MTTIVGADAGGVSSFVPWLGILSGAMGGSKPAGDSEAVKQMKAELEKQRQEKLAAEKKMRIVVYGAVGVGVLGALYLLLKK